MNKNQFSILQNKVFNRNQTFANIFDEYFCLTLRYQFKHSLTLNRQNH